MSDIKEMDGGHEFAMLVTYVVLGSFVMSYSSVIINNHLCCASATDYICVPALPSHPNKVPVPGAHEAR